MLVSVYPFPLVLFSLTVAVISYAVAVIAPLRKFPFVVFDTFFVEDAQSIGFAVFPLPCISTVSDIHIIDRVNVLRIHTNLVMSLICRKEIRAPIFAIKSIEFFCK